MNTAQPAANPKKANQPTFFKYQIKSILSIPIAATPAAEPIINIEPPVPAEKAMKCHRLSSIGAVYMPIVAATNGTLSIYADKKPSTIITMS